MTSKRLHTAALVAVGLTACSSIAQATDVFRLEGYGAISRGMGGVATATESGPAGMMVNPATLSLASEDRQVMVGLDLVTTDLSVTNKTTGETVTSNSHGSNRGPYVAPEVAVTGRYGALSLGTGAFAQGGLGTEYGSSSFLSQATGGLKTGLENSSRLLVLNVPFSASYKVTDKLNIGGSVDAMWQGLNLNLLLGADQVGSLIGANRVSGSLVSVLGGLPALRGAHFSLTKNNPLGSGVEAWGAGGRLGLTYQATDSTRLGLAYSPRSMMADMSGRATLTAIDATLGDIALGGKIKIQDFQMPDSVNIGISHAMTPKLTVAADVSEVFWKEVMKDIKVAFVADGGGNINILLPQNYRNQTILAVGGAYQATDTLTLRAGFRYATEALRSSTLFAVIPATPRMHLSLGLTYAFTPSSKLDLAYTHAFQDRMDNASLPNSSAPIHTTHAQNNAVVNYRYSF